MKLTADNPEHFGKDDHGPLYRLSEARRLYSNVDKLEGAQDLYLAWSERNGGVSIEFTVLSLVVDYGDGEAFCRSIVHGDGTPFDRDMRHSYWGFGDDGYLHCLGTDEILAIGKALGRWFR